MTPAPQRKRVSRGPEALRGVEGQGPFPSETLGRRPKHFHAPFENPPDSRNSPRSCEKATAPLCNNHDRAGWSHYKAEFS